MYCNKCNCSLNEGNHICPNCGFDNDATIDLSSVVRKISKKEEKKSKVITVTSLFILLSLGIVIFYLLNGEKTEENVPINSTTTSTIKNESSLTNIDFNDIKFKYDKEIYSNNDNKLIYNANENIYIDYLLIDANEYNDVINGNDCNTIAINDVKNIFTFAGDSSFSYVFMLNDNYYNFTIHYVDDAKIYTETVQLELSKVLSTISQK